MASYAKQMMELAARWLAVNPDPESPFLQVPDKVHTRANSTEENAAKVAELRRRVQKSGRSTPAMQADLAELDRAIERMRECEKEIEEDFREIHDHINRAPKAQHEKHSVDAFLTTDRGRWCLAWARHGYNAFELSPDFTAAMLLTDPTALDISTVRLPFKGFLITIPAGFATGPEGLPYTKIHVWETAKRDARMLDALEKVTDVLDDLPLERQFQTLTDLQKRPGLLVDPALQHLHSPKKLVADDTPYLCIYATDGVNAFTTAIEMKDLSWKVVEALPDNLSEDADRQVRHSVQQIVFGLLGYLSAVHDAMTPRQVHRKKQKRAEAEDAIKHWEVGRNVKIDPQLVRAARMGSREVAFRLKNRFIVRGHYRNQAHGPRRSERTSRWIAPFWKGPEEGARLIHTYQPTPPGANDGD